MWPFRRKRDPAVGPSGPENLGGRGEKLARRFLRKQGLKILAQNYRCPVGEADLIALEVSPAPADAETIVFVEVKTRRDDRAADPESAVNPAKRRKLQRVAEYYLAAREVRGYAVRFDVVAVLLRPRAKPQIRHIPSAF